MVSDVNREGEEDNSDWSSGESVIELVLKRLHLILGWLWSWNGKEIAIRPRCSAAFPRGEILELFSGEVLVTVVPFVEFDKHNSDKCLKVYKISFKIKVHSDNKQPDIIMRARYRVDYILRRDCTKA